MDTLTLADQLCADNGYSIEELPLAVNDKDG